MPNEHDVLAGDDSLDDRDVTENPHESNGPADDGAKPASPHAYDQTRLNALTTRDVRDAAEFESELKDIFDLVYVDDELRGPLCETLERFLVMYEDGEATTCGLIATVLKTFLKCYPRGFGRYFVGVDSWPRPSKIVQAEIDARMPFAMNWLRLELKEALKEEASATHPAQ